MTGVRNNTAGQPLNNEPHNENAATNSRRDSNVIVNIDFFTVNIFFDGTLNNMYNTDLRTKENPTAEDLKNREIMKKQTSYTNDLSNVALLYKACSQDYVSVDKIYVQGAGTKEGRKDNILGYVAAWGGTGVLNRVDQTLEQLKTMVEPIKTNQLRLNIFGFSRGSFYARYFISKLKEKREQPFSKNIKDKDIKIIFVGLYDTVSSEGGNNYDDVEAFKLNIGRQHVKGRVVHLTAQNDYRYHFPLTQINTAISDGVGFECSFPGAHSDIGGGYTPNTSEIKKGLNLYLSTLEKNGFYPKTGEIYWEWFREQGYYKGDPMSKNPREWGDFCVELRFHSTDITNLLIGIEYYVVTSRRTVPSKDYQFTLLNGMKKLAEEFAVKFQGEGKKNLNYLIATMQNDPLLNRLDQYTTRYLLDHYMDNSFHEISLDAKELGFSEEDRKTLYHSYLHNSLNPPDIGNAGIADQTVPPQRNIIQDNKSYERTVHGVEELVEAFV